MEILNGLIQFILFLMGKFNSKVEPPLGMDCVRLSKVHCIYVTILNFITNSLTCFGGPSPISWSFAIVFAKGIIY